MEIKAFFEPTTSTLSYVVSDPLTGDAVLIDPVYDIDPVAVRLCDKSIRAVAEYVSTRSLRVRYSFETHAHADHISGGPLAQSLFGAMIAIGERITVVQEVFKEVFNLGPSFATDGRQFDKLVKDGEVIEAGSLKIKAIATPGHTPACSSYLIQDALFTGDALFMPDYGTGRCDFPKGSARDLYRSITEELYALPDDTRVFVGHDYQPGGRGVRWETTIGDSKERNIQLRAGTTEESFIRFREERDRSLRPPKLIFQSIQVNINGGQLPPPETNGRRYLKIPLNFFDRGYCDSLVGGIS